MTDREKINKLFELVSENDLSMREYILDQCKENKEIRQGYVSHYEHSLSQVTA